MTPLKRDPLTPGRKPPTPGRRDSVKPHNVPLGRDEKHMGATENQVSATMPPRADDDEPKQG